MRKVDAGEDARIRVLFSCFRKAAESAGNARQRKTGRFESDAIAEKVDQDLSRRRVCIEPLPDVSFGRAGSLRQRGRSGGLAIAHGAVEAETVSDEDQRGPETRRRNPKQPCLAVRAVFVR